MFKGLLFILNLWSAKDSKGKVIFKEKPLFIVISCQQAINFYNINWFRTYYCLQEVKIDSMYYKKKLPCDLNYRLIH